MSKSAKQMMKPLKVGRPRREINFALFEALCRIQCTLVEIASVFGVSDDTVERRCVEYYGKNFADVFKEHSSVGKISLRRMQFKQALCGNTTMLIWLGKQILGQKDNALFNNNIHNTVNNGAGTHRVNGKDAELQKQMQEELRRFTL